MINELLKQIPKMLKPFIESGNYRCPDTQTTQILTQQYMTNSFSTYLYTNTFFSAVHCSIYPPLKHCTRHRLVLHQSCDTGFLALSSVFSSRCFDFFLFFEACDAWPYGTHPFVSSAAQALPSQRSAVVTGAGAEGRAAR